MPCICRGEEEVQRRKKELEAGRWKLLCCRGKFDEWVPSQARGKFGPKKLEATSAMSGWASCQWRACLHRLGPCESLPPFRSTLRSKSSGSFNAPVPVFAGTHGVSGRCALAGSGNGALTSLPPHCWPWKADAGPPDVRGFGCHLREGRRLSGPSLACRLN